MFLNQIIDRKDGQGILMMQGTTKNVAGLPSASQPYTDLCLALLPNLPTIFLFFFL